MENCHSYKKVNFFQFKFKKNSAFIIFSFAYAVLRREENGTSEKQLSPISSGLYSPIPSFFEDC